MNNWWKLGRESLEALRTPLGVTASGAGEHFHAIFGRDSLWTAMLAMEAARLRPEDDEFRAWTLELVTSILRGLAQLQGQVENDHNEEQPGKIVHEYWERIPPNLLRGAWPLVEGRYYGSLDATFLYILCLQQVHEMFGAESLLTELWSSYEAALQWGLTYSDMDNDGLVEYQRRNHDGIGLLNQVWRDSGDSVLLPGDLTPEQPLAWIEVQGYALAAYSGALLLYRERGLLTSELAEQLTQRIQGLKDGLERFWLEAEGCFTLALDGTKTPVRAVTSNVGHLLWCKCIDGERAQRVCERLTQPDILTDWGLRTLSQRSYYYNPLVYHRGTIWPFDNAITAIGLRSYGYVQEAHQVSNAILRAIEAFELPVELYCVLPSRWIREPRLEQDWLLADYPESCSVQAWTAASLLYFAAALDLVPTPA